MDPPNTCRPNRRIIAPSAAGVEYRSCGGLNVPNRGTRTTKLIRTTRQSLRNLGRTLDRLATAAVDIETAALRVATKVEST